jgi:predicted O-methyltransferase YrrM
MRSDFENITPAEIDCYCEDNTSDLCSIFTEIERQTFLQTPHGRMLSGKLQGQLLNMLCSIAKPKIALEIGAFTAYSTLAIALALPENAKLISIEVNPEYEIFIKENLRKANILHKVDIIIGDAKKIIPEIKENFDFVFLDADKQNYPQYFDILLPKLNKDAIFIADNVLWDGKILEKKSKNKDIIALQNFNKKIQNEKSLQNILLPVRDGLMIAKKI